MTKATTDIRSLARAQTKLAVRTLTGICGSEAAPAAAVCKRLLICSTEAGVGPLRWSLAQMAGISVSSSVRSLILLDNQPQSQC